MSFAVDEFLAAVRSVTWEQVQAMQWYEMDVSIDRLGHSNLDLHSSRQRRLSDARDRIDEALKGHDVLERYWFMRAARQATETAADVAGEAMPNGKRDAAGTLALIAGFLTDALIVSDRADPTRPRAIVCL